MLNELYRLSQALQKAGIAPRDWHKDFKEIPKTSNKKPCYRIALGKTGDVTDISVMSDAVAAKVRKWERGAGNSFPAFNLPPLYRIVTDESQKKLLDSWRKGKATLDVETLKSWCSIDTRNWNEKTSPRIEWCLARVPTALLQILGNIPSLYAALKETIDRSTAYTSDPSGIFERFHQAIETCLWKKLPTGENLPQLLSVLIHEGSAKEKPEKDRGAVSICLDVDDWTEYPVVHEKTMAWINESLLATTQSITADATTVDAFALDADGNDETFPSVKLPVLAAVILRAMSKESPCQLRYSTADANSFSVGREGRRRMKGAIEWLASPPHENQTWGRADGNARMFAYPSEVPPTLPQITACFGARSPDIRTARFEEYADDVITNLRAIPTPLKDIELQVFSLRKMDKARTKVVFHRNYTAQQLADAAGEWQTGCNNIPDMSWRVWGQEKGKWETMQPRTPFPLELAACLNQVWKLDGSTNNAVPVASPTDGIELLLDEKTSHQMADHMLAIFLQNSKPLLISLGNTIHSIGNDILSIRTDTDRQRQLLPAIAGLLLHKLGHRKEVYMNNAPYLVGHILKLSDDLHALYCKEVRNGQLPPQLLGGALMTAALDSPEQAISQLAQRIMPYLHWAKTNSTESAGLSRFFLKSYADIEEKLQGRDFPKRLNDAERTQLLLGYLARTASQQNEQ